MFYIEIINDKINRYTSNENIAKKFYSNYTEKDSEPVRAFDGKLYLSADNIPSEIIVAENKANIQEQIQALELKITARRMREALFGNKESINFIEDIEEQIAILRGKV